MFVAHLNAMTKNFRYPEKKYSSVSQTTAANKLQTMKIELFLAM